MQQIRRRELENDTCKVKLRTLETRPSLVDRILSAGTGRTIGVGRCGDLSRIGPQGRLLQLRLRVRLRVRGKEICHHTARHLAGEYDDLVDLADSEKVLQLRRALALMLFGGYEFNVDDHIVVRVLRLSLFN